jgi:hypothetical protein
VAIVPQAKQMHPHLVQATREELRKPTEYNHNRTVGAQLLDRALDQRAVPELLALVDEFFETMGERSGSELRLGVIGWEDTLTAAAGALTDIHLAHAQLPRAQTAEHMRRVAAGYHDHMMRKATLACLRALGMLGDANALEQTQSQRLLYENDDTFRCGVLSALAELAKHNPDTRAAIAEIENPDEDDNQVILAHALMHAAAGAGIDMQAAIDAAQASSTYGSDRWLQYGILLCQAVGASKAPLSLIANYVYSEHRYLREAARAALRARSIKPQKITELSPLDAERIVATQGLGGVVIQLHNALAIRLHYLIDCFERSGQDATHSGLGPAVAAAVERELNRLQDIGDGESPPDATRALILALAPYAQQQEAATQLSRCLAHANDDLFVVALGAATATWHAAAIAEGLSTRDGYTASQAAQWLASRNEDEAVKAALKRTVITTKQLAKLAK